MFYPNTNMASRLLASEDSSQYKTWEMQLLLKLVLKVQCNSILMLTLQYGLIELIKINGVTMFKNWNFVS